MIFSSVLGKKRKQKKLIREYVRDQVKQKRSFDEQLENLEAQLHSKLIDKSTYERLRDILEIHFMKQKEEAREKLTPIA